MAEMKSFIISLALISLIVGSISIYLGNLTNNYDVSFNEEELDDYNNIQEIYNQTKELETETTAIDPNSNPFQELVSIIDGFFTGAYNTLVLAFKSFDIFDNVAGKTLDDTGAGQYTSLFKTTLTIIVLLTLIFIIVRAIVKVDV